MGTTTYAHSPARAHLRRQSAGHGFDARHAPTEVQNCLSVRLSDRLQVRVRLCGAVSRVTVINVEMLRSVRNHNTASVSQTADLLQKLIYERKFGVCFLLLRNNSFSRIPATMRVRVQTGFKLSRLIIV